MSISVRRDVVLILTVAHGNGNSPNVVFPMKDSF